MNTLASGKAPWENRCADDSGRLALTRPKSGPAAGSCRKGRFATARHFTFSPVPRGACRLRAKRVRPGVRLFDFRHDTTPGKF
jgi:hypothetical protein